MALSARCTYVRSIAIGLMLICEFFSVHVSAKIFLTYKYPLPGNFSRVELRCKIDNFNLTVLQDADFFLGETELSPQTVVGYSRDRGVLSYTITPEKEGPLTCRSRDGEETSDVLKLAGQPMKYHDCENKPVQYQLLPYSEHNLYTIPCLIKPGNLREKYTVVWTQVSRHTGSDSSLIDLSKVNMTNFDLYLEAKNLPPGDEYVECRVDIKHDPTDERHYCGPKIAVAVKAEIVTPLPHLTRVQSGHDVNLSCSARGTNLIFQWSYRGKTYDSTSDCHSGICVNTELSSLDPLTKTSHLSIHGFQTTIEGDTTVTWHVAQNVDEQFHSIPLTSIGTVTVYDEVLTTNPPSDTYPPSTTPSTEGDSTSDPATTHTTQSALNNQHTYTYLLGFTIPIALVLLISMFVFLLLRKWRDSCRARHSKFQKESCIERTSVVPSTLAQHKSIVSGQPWPPNQISYSSGGTSISPMKDLTRSCPTGQRISSTLTTTPLLIEEIDGPSQDSVSTAPQGDAHIKYSPPIQACPPVGVQQKSTSILQPPCQISSQRKPINLGGSSHPLSSESPSLSHQQSALGCLTNKQRRRNQRQFNMKHQLAQTRSYHQQHSVPVNNRRYSRDNPVQVLKLQRPSSSSEPSLAGEVTGTDAKTGSKVKCSFLSSPLHVSREATSSPALGDETLSTIQEASCEPLIKTSSPHIEWQAQRDLSSSLTMLDQQLLLQNSLSHGDDGRHTHPTEDGTSCKNDVCKTHLTSAPANEILPADMTFDPLPSPYEQPSSIDSTSHSQVTNLPATVDHCCQGHPPELCVHENHLISSLDPTTGPILDQDKCEDSLTYSHETQILLPTSGPPIDPYNTREYIPTCFTPVATLSQCTHDGRPYYDAHNDFSLEIPAGAIPEGESITIDIGVALYGQFQYPKGLRPVSPVFWFCVRDQKDFQFLKPVTVTIPHCLNLGSHNNIESLGLTFLTGDHEMNSQQMYQFQPAEGDVLIEPLKKCGVIETTHFCSQCIAGEVTEELMKKANFCISAVLPTVISDTKSAYFFITFLLKTCLNVVEEQINKDTALQGHDRKYQPFQFSSDGEEKALEMVLPQSLPGKWEIGRIFRNKISVSDIDFFDKDREELALMEEQGTYPPRFGVVITRLSITTHHVTIVFKGAMNDLELAIPIIPPRPPISPFSTSSCYLSSHEQEVATPASPLEIKDLFDITTELNEVAPRWRYIGLALRLCDPQLDKIAAGGKPVTDCLTDMLREWLNQNYEVSKYGKPSWQILAEAVRHPAGGNTAALANKICRTHSVHVQL